MLWNFLEFEFIKWIAEKNIMKFCEVFTKSFAKSKQRN